MKRALLICYFIIVGSLLHAQRIYFIYLQTESAGPFFVRMNDKLYSSASSGYLILSRLVDSTYNFKLGFPGKTIDLDFSISLNHRDHGYLIKDFGEKGWGLFDLQSLGIQMSTSNVKNSAQPNIDSSFHVNAFTDMLSKATDDPSLKQNTIFVKELEKKPVIVQTVQKEEKKPTMTQVIPNEEKKADVAQVKTKEEQKPDVARVIPKEAKKPDVTQAKTKEEQKPDVAQVTPNEEKKRDVTQVKTKEEQKSDVTAQLDNKSVEAAKKTTDVAGQNIDSSAEITTVEKRERYERSHVTKLSGIGTVEGFESVFIDEDQNGQKDTVRILIPVENTETVKQEPKSDSTVAGRKFLDINPDSEYVVNKSPVETKKESPKKLWPFSKNKTEAADARKCQNLAGNDDFLKLRRKMAGRTNDDGMIDEAKKYFRTKCFSSEQIKNLSSMFLSNAGKYNFFYTSYNYVSDKENFASLQSELKDDFYVSQFRNMLRN